VTPAIIGWSLAAVSAIWGLLTWFVFRRFTDHAALRAVRKRMYAHLMEIRLYSEEPALVWNAQKDLIVDNARFLALIAKPVLMLTLPFAVLYAPLDSVYSRSPLAIGHSAIVTLQMPRDLREDDTQFVIQAPPGIEIETPPVRVFAERQIVWRVRPRLGVRGTLRFFPPGRGADSAVVIRSIAAGERTLALLPRRENSPGVLWVDVDYPQSPVDIAGASLSWLVWFLTISTVSAAVATLAIRLWAAINRATYLR
jgi:hypothetical protein